MTELPDFNQIARVAVMTFYGTTPRPSSDEQAAVANIAEQLRRVWNARGAADLDAIDGVSNGIIDAEIRTLDR